MGEHMPITARNPVYLIEVDYGPLGSSFAETDPDSLDCTDRERVISTILAGNGERLITSIWLADFAEGRLTDVSADIAEAVRDRILDEGDGCTSAIKTVDHILGGDLQSELDELAYEAASGWSYADEHRLGAFELGIGSNVSVWRRRA